MRYGYFFVMVTFFFCSASDSSKAETQTKALKFFNDATEEPVVFYSRENHTSEKKLARKGILIKRPQAKATVLICHGFMCDKYDINLLHVMFKDYNSFAFDFRAHGEDTNGQCCTLGREESYDVIAAARFIKNHPELKDTPLIVYGFSMGAVAAIIAQANDKGLFDGLILDCPYDSTDKLLERGINNFRLSLFGYDVPLPGTSFIKNYAYNSYVQSCLQRLFRSFSHLDAGHINLQVSPAYPEEAIKYVTAPCFFIGCVNDTKAPEEAVLSVYQGAQGFKRCWIDPDGRRHFDTIFRQTYTYFYKVNRFVKSVISGSYKEKVREKINKDKVNLL